MGNTSGEPPSAALQKDQNGNTLNGKAPVSIEQRRRSQTEATLSSLEHLKTVQEEHSDQKGLPKRRNSQAGYLGNGFSGGVQISSDAGANENPQRHMRGLDREYERQPRVSSLDDVRRETEQPRETIVTEGVEENGLPAVETSLRMRKNRRGRPGFGGDGGDSSPRESSRSPRELSFEEKVRAWEKRMGSDPEFGKERSSEIRGRRVSVRRDMLASHSSLDTARSHGELPGTGFESNGAKATSRRGAFDAGMGRVFGKNVVGTGEEPDVGDEGKPSRTPADEAHWIEKELQDRGEALYRAGVLSLEEPGERGGKPRVVDRHEGIEEGSKGAAGVAPGSRSKRGRMWKPNPAMQFDLIVQVENTVFQLHKSAVCARSGRLARLTSARPHVEHTKVILPDLPGGARTFELVLRFCYGERLHMSPGNIAALRCAAEYLEMTEDYSPPGHLNLLMLTDAFLDRVALRTTTDALHVLLGCQAFGPVAEACGLPFRATEAIAEQISQLEPDHLISNRGQPETPSTGQGGRRSPRQNTLMEGTTNPDHPESRGVVDAPLKTKWVRPLSKLEVGWFARLVRELERRRVDHRLIGLLVMLYAQRAFPKLFSSRSGATLRSVFSLPSRPHVSEPLSAEMIQTLENHGEERAAMSYEQTRVLEVLVTCLPWPLDAILPGSACQLLAAARQLALSPVLQEDLEDRVSGQLALVSAGDLVLVSTQDGPSGGLDVEWVLRMVEAFLERAAWRKRARARVNDVLELDGRLGKRRGWLLRREGKARAASGGATVGDNSPVKTAGIETNRGERHAQASQERGVENARRSWFGVGELEEREYHVGLAKEEERRLNGIRELEKASTPLGSSKKRESFPLKKRAGKRPDSMKFPWVVAGLHSRRRVKMASVSPVRSRSSPEADVKKPGQQIATPWRRGKGFDVESREDTKGEEGQFDVEGLEAESEGVQSEGVEEVGKQPPNWGTLKAEVDPKAIETAVAERLKGSPPSGVSPENTSGTEKSVRGFGSDFEVVSGDTETPAKAGTQPGNVALLKAVVEKPKPAPTYRGLRRYTRSAGDGDDEEVYVRESPAHDLKEPAPHLWEEAHLSVLTGYSPAADREPSPERTGVNALLRRRGRRGKKHSSASLGRLDTTEFSPPTRSSVSLGSLQHLLMRSKRSPPPTPQGFGGLENDLNTGEGLAMEKGLAAAMRPEERESEAEARPSRAEVMAVAGTLDEYLRLVGEYSHLSVEDFLAVATCLPIDAREKHDGLYAALSIFLKTHSAIPREAKIHACRCVDWAKLSEALREAAAANEDIPDHVRMQVLCVEQKLMKRKLMEGPGLTWADTVPNGASIIDRDEQLRFLNLRAAAAEAFYEDMSSSLSPLQGLAASTTVGGGPGLRIIKECAALKRDHQRLEIEAALVKMRLADLERDHHVLLQQESRGFCRCFWMRRGRSGGKA